MILSYEKQFLFIHVGKTAGTNVARALEPYAHRPEVTTPAKWLDKIGIHVNYLGPHRWRRFRIHATAATAKRHLPTHVWDGLFKFAFVRNPYARLLSQYHFMLREMRHHHHETVTRLGSFDAYVAWEHRRDKRTQSSALLDRDGRCLVDFVGRFETLSSDFAHVCERISVDATLPAEERPPKPFADAFANPETRRLADELIGRDAEVFGYDLDGPLSTTEELNAVLKATAPTSAVA
ncbi:MAG: sulfotransferase family 2 domain-containing protein [Planctomycetota bacterium]